MPIPVAENILQRIEYVHTYFAGKFPAEAPAETDDKYDDMGKPFRTIYEDGR